MKNKISFTPEISPIIDFIISDCKKFGISVHWIKQQIETLLPFLQRNNASRISGVREGMVATELGGVWERACYQINQYEPFDIANIRASIASRLLVEIENVIRGKK